jgi:hypothetical protein
MKNNVLFGEYTAGKNLTENPEEEQMLLTKVKIKQTTQPSPHKKAAATFECFKRLLSHTDDNVYFHKKGHIQGSYRGYENLIKLPLFSIQ